MAYQGDIGKSGLCAGGTTPNRAFTRIDLIAITAIIGFFTILAPLRLSNSGNWEAPKPDPLRVQRLQCLANVKQLVAAELMYAADNQGKFCPSYLNYKSDGLTNVWMGALAAYHGHTNGIWLCPSTTNSPVHSYKGAADAPWTYTDQGSDPPTPGSYAINGYLGLGRNYNQSREGSFKVRNVFHNQIAARRPSLTPAFCDAIYWNCRLEETDAPSRDLYQPQAVLTSGNTRQILTQFIARHGDFPASEAPHDLDSNLLPGAINIAFADGHAENVPLENLWTLYWHKNWNPQKVSLPHPPPK
jgi:prepilin-type processing-associated H-X9-DG protein